MSRPAPEWMLARGKGEEEMGRRQRTRAEAVLAVKGRPVVEQGGAMIERGRAAKTGRAVVVVEVRGAQRQMPR